MKKKVIKIIGVLFILLIIHQVYWYNSLNGNLVVYVSNVSEKDSVEINLFLDDKKIDKYLYLNSNHFLLKKYPLTVSPGKHKITVKTKEGDVKEEYIFYSYLIKRVVVEYQGKDNQLDNENSEFLVDSHFVFSNFSIQ